MSVVQHNAATSPPRFVLAALGGSAGGDPLEVLCLALGAPRRYLAGKSATATDREPPGCGKVPQAGGAAPVPPTINSVPNSPGDALSGCVVVSLQHRCGAACLGDLCGLLPCAWHRVPCVEPVVPGRQSLSGRCGAFSVIAGLARSSRSRIPPPNTFRMQSVAAPPTPWPEHAALALLI